MIRPAMRKFQFVVDTAGPAGLFAGIMQRRKRRSEPGLLVEKSRNEMFYKLDSLNTNTQFNNQTSGRVAQSKE